MKDAELDWTCHEIELIDNEIHLFLHQLRFGLKPSPSHIVAFNAAVARRDSLTLAIVKHRGTGFASSISKNEKGKMK